MKLRQVAAKTDVEGRAGALSVELRLGSLHLDVGTGTLVWRYGFGAWISGRCEHDRLDTSPFPTRDTVQSLNGWLSIFILVFLGV